MTKSFLGRFWHNWKHLGTVQYIGEAAAPRSGVQHYEARKCARCGECQMLVDGAWVPVPQSELRE